MQLICTDWSCQLACITQWMLMLLNVHCPFLNRINIKEANFDLVLLASELEQIHDTAEVANFTQFLPILTKLCECSIWSYKMSIIEKCWFPIGSKTCIKFVKQDATNIVQIHSNNCSKSMWNM